MWIRYVVVPGWSDDDAGGAHALTAHSFGMNWKVKVEKLEMLPYHELGKHKIGQPWRKYELDGVHLRKRSHGTPERNSGSYGKCQLLITETKHHCQIQLLKRTSVQRGG